MAIRGELLSADLSNVFQMLALNRKRGGLVVQEQGNLLSKRCLYINEDRVALHEPPPDRPIVALLVEMGVLSYPQYQGVLTKASRYNTEPVKLLRQQGVLEEEHLEQARRRVQEEGIMEVFLWRNISFELQEGAEGPPKDAHYFSIDHLIMEAARRQDEWVQFVEPTGANRQIYIRTGSADEGAESDLDPVQHIVLDHVDGVRGSREIVEETGLPRYFVDISLRALHEAGRVEPLGLSELVTTGDNLVRGGNVPDGLRLYRTALQFDRRNITLHKRLAGAYLEVERIAKAGAHYRFCATSLLASGMRREAITIYENVLKLLPTDFRTLERCVDLLSEESELNGPEDEDVVEQGRRLLGFFQDTGQQERALALAERLRRIDPQDDDLLSAVARLHLRLGHTDAGAKAYMMQAERRTEEGNLDAAIEIYRTLGGIDSANRHIYHAKASSLQRMQEEKRRSRRRSTLRIMMAVAVLVLGGGYAVWCFTASAALNTIEEPDAETSRGATALAIRLRKVADQYPFTPAGMEAASRADGLEKKARALADAIRRREEEETAARQAKIDRATVLLNKALRLRSQGSLMEARAAFLAALAEAGETDWDEATTARKNVSSIEQYVEEAKTLREEGEAALKEGRLDVAFEKLRHVAESYFNAPGCRDITIPLQVVAIPADGTIDVEVGGTSQRAIGQLEVRLPYGLPSRVRVSLEGYHTAERTIDPRTGDWRTPVILDRVVGSDCDARQPVVVLASLEGDRVAALARNGKVAALDVSPRGDPVWQDVDATLQTLRLPPAVSPDGVLAVSERGLIALLERRSMRPRWKTTLPSLSEVDWVVRPVPLKDGFAVAAGSGSGGRVARLEPRRGEIRWDQPIEGEVAGLAATADAVGVLLRDGQLVLLDPESGAERNRLEGPYGGNPCSTDQGAMLLHRPGVGLVSVDPATGVEQTRIPFKGAVQAGPVTLPCGVVVAVEGLGLVIGGDERAESLPLPELASAIIPGPSDRCAVKLRNGRVLLVDAARRTFLFGVQGRPGKTDLEALTESTLVLALSDQRLGFVPLH